MKNTIESIDRAMKHIALIDELEDVIRSAVSGGNYNLAEMAQVEQLKSVREVSRLQKVVENLKTKGIETEVVNHV